MTETHRKALRGLAWVFFASAVLALLASYYGYPSDPYGAPHLRGSRFVQALLKFGLASLFFVLSRRGRFAGSNRGAVGS